MNESQAEKLIRDGLTEVGLPENDWAEFVSASADGICDWTEKTNMWRNWDDDWTLNLKGEQVMPAEQRFDWTAASIGGAVGFVSAYAVMKAFRGRNKDDEFTRI